MFPMAAVIFAFLLYRSLLDDAVVDSLKCNTEKDKNVRLNHRTAGMETIYAQYKLLQCLTCMVLKHASIKSTKSSVWLFQQILIIAQRLIF